MQATAFQNRFPGLVGLLASRRCFDDWDVEQRYHEDGAVTEEALKVHRDCARRLLIAVELFRG